MSESLGQRLRAAREAKGVSLDEVERITRIRAKFLDAFEQDDFSGLPSETQARGFLRNYAEYLNLEAGELLASFDSARRRKTKLGSTQPRRGTPSPAATPPNGSKAAPLPPRPAPTENVGRAPQILSRRPRWLSPDLLFAMAVSLVMVILLVWAIGQLTPGLTAAPTPTLSVIIPGQTLAPTRLSETATPEATSTLALPTPLPEYVGVNISLRAEQRTWVSVKVDGVEQFVGQLAAGEIKDFVGQSVVEIATGNGLGTRIIWNGRDQGTLGKLGEAVIRLWTADGMLVPTATVAPTTPP